MFVNWINDLGVPMEIVEKKSFRDETIELDGRGFIDCSFTKCHFIFRANEPFGLRNPTLNNVTMEFADHAALTVQALHLLYKNGGSFRDWVEYELKSVDGSFGTSKH
jgi:hypothetical protein